LFFSFASSAVCALRTRWPQRALRPLLWGRPRRAARCASGSSSCCTAHWASPRDCHCFPQAG